MAAMTTPRPGRTGVLIIRLWVEDAPGQSVRARIIQSMDITAEEPVATSASTVEDIVRKVREWVDAFVKAEVRS
jgi:hypothetical protein